MPSRRDFLKLAGLVASSAAVAACGPVYDQVAPLTQNTTPWPTLAPADFAALNRLTFGPRLEERQRVAEIGLAAWVEEQLAPDTVDDGPLTLRLRRLDTLNLKAHELVDLSDELFDNEDRTTIPTELRRATLLRQIYSRRQLYEVLVEFWTDHFNISVDKGACFYLKTVDDRAVVRAQALGTFRDLLWASAHSPAMLVYLDNQENRRGTPNENYARELLELHTLGVDGGYTQADVMALARCLTGWTVKESFWRGDFTFEADWHDPDPKELLGLQISPAGQAEAEAVLEHLATHPTTAHFIVTKLARRFLGQAPATRLISRATQTFLETAGDIRAVLRVLLLDGLQDPARFAPKFKRPVNYIVSALRQLNVLTEVSETLLAYLKQLGQLPFGWPTPDGYPDRTEGWQGNLLPRWQFALALAQNEIADTTLDLETLLQAANATDTPTRADQLATLLLGAPLPAKLRAQLLKALNAAGTTPDELPAILTAGLLASPAFQWR